MTAEATAADIIASEIRRHGSVSFSRFQELALYGPGGFYESGGAGRERDFLTSAEVGPLFGAVMACRIDAVWDEFGRPDPFVVIDAGAGPGTLAVSVLAAEPACGPALRYVLVDRAEAQRARHAEHLSVVPPSEAFAGGVDADDDLGDADKGAPTAVGPLVVSLESLPRKIDSGLIIANELLDNLPVDLIERHDGEWIEVRVTVADDGSLKEQLAPAGPALTRVAHRVETAAGTTLRGRIPIQRAAAEWLDEAVERLDRGRIIIIDYARPTAEMATLATSSWLRSYRGHARRGAPLLDPGGADITCDVATDQLTAARPADVHTDQAGWLRSYGIDQLVAEGRDQWHEQAAVGDLQAVRARSRIGEGEALTDPDGLGGFAVLEWRVR